MGEFRDHHESSLILSTYELILFRQVVHKQFNSPIGLYSEQNIADTIKCQTSAVP